MRDESTDGRRKQRPTRSPSQAQPPEPAPLLATKLYRPRPRSHLVPRPRLIGRLETGLDTRLTLIAGPAGSGKTTLLAAWLSQSADAGRRIAWLALDASDSDPIQFLRYLIAALQTIVPSVGATVLPVLRSARPPALETILAVLVNDLALLPENSLLVLDDYHSVDAPAVHQALGFLLDHLPPQLHLIVASRADPALPLARLRARGQLTELRAADLRFTSDEAQRFFGDAMGMALSSSDVAALEARTEGWIAGLQLAALSLQDRPEAQRSELIEQFTGSHRFVVDYLIDEVLAVQPPQVQRFLLATSILERLSGPLCDAVLGLQRPGPDDEEHGASSQRMLEALHRGNLFVVALDEQRRWYRYHHLFAQVLQERLSHRLLGAAEMEQPAVLHRRAAAWFEANGLAAEAIQHALAADDWEYAARLCEAHAPRLLVRGHVHTALGWLALLPEAQFRARPELYPIHALGLFFVNQLDAAEQRLQDGEAQLPPAPIDDSSRATLGYITVIRASIARYRGDRVRCVSLARRALELVPESNTLLRASPSVDVASDYVVTGDVTAANERRMMAAVEAAAASGDLQTHITSFVLLAGLRRRQGRLRLADETYQQAAALASGPDGRLALINSAAIFFRRGDLLREWNYPDQALELLRQGCEHVQRALVTQADIVTFGYISLARQQQARGDGAGARATLDELYDLAQQRDFAPHLLSRVDAARAYLALLQDDLAGAVAWAETSGLDAGREVPYLHELEYLVLSRVWIAEGRRDPDGRRLHDAVRLLDRLLESALAGARTDSVIEIQVLRALAFDAQGQAQRAAAALEEALELAAPERYVRVFADEHKPMAALLTTALHQRRRGGDQHGRDSQALVYGERLLEVLRAEGAVAPGSAAPSEPAYAPGLEPLTERELEVLRLLAQGRSNGAIAAELIIAVGTVKRHVSNIMGKLEAQSRLEAVARARALGFV